MWGGYYVAARTEMKKARITKRLMSKLSGSPGARGNATRTEARRHQRFFVGDGLLMWRAVAYCGIPLKYSTVSASGCPNTAV
jgi:hypothetical protein